MQHPKAVMPAATAAAAAAEATSGAEHCFASSLIRFRSACSPSLEREPFGTGAGRTTSLEPTRQQGERAFQHGELVIQIHICNI